MSGIILGSIVEDAAPARLEALGYAVLHGPDMSPIGDSLGLIRSQGAREGFTDVVLKNRLRQGLGPLDPALPESVR